MIPGYTKNKRYINKYFHKSYYKYMSRFFLTLKIPPRWNFFVIKNVHDGVQEEIV